VQDIIKFLSGTDLRKIGKSNDVIMLVKEQKDFDKLTKAMRSDDRVIAMRAADAAEKISRIHPEFLQKNKSILLHLLSSEENVEIKWHLALMIPKLSLTKKEALSVWNKFMQWAMDIKESKIVRVNSMDGLAELLKYFPAMKREYLLILDELDKENIPSITARIKKIRKKKI
jgi:hypothetical protein